MYFVINQKNEIFNQFSIISNFNKVAACKNFRLPTSALATVVLGHVPHWIALENVLQPVTVITLPSMVCHTPTLVLASTLLLVTFAMAITEPFT